MSYEQRTGKAKVLIIHVRVPWSVWVIGCANSEYSVCGMRKVKCFQKPALRRQQKLRVILRKMINRRSLKARTATSSVLIKCWKNPSCYELFMKTDEYNVLLMTFLKISLPKHPTWLTHVGHFKLPFIFYCQICCQWWNKRTYKRYGMEINNWEEICIWEAK